jgi:hypothetical protein
MNQSSRQLRAHIPPQPNIQLEATSGSPKDYDDRNGYLADFLGDGGGFLVPLPLLKAKGDLVKVERAPKERPFELRYQNFSVIMRRSRRFCCITGVNIDGTASFFSPKRPGWKTDPRIPKAAQVSGAEFYVPTEFDRGHMVRRLDPVWGTESSARLANADTHHYTNSCPKCICLMTRRGAISKTGFFRRNEAGIAKGRSLPVQSFKSQIPCTKG